MARQSDLRFTFQPGQGPSLDVVSFRLIENLSQPFRLELELSSSSPDLDFGTLLDQPAVFAIHRGDQVVRYVHGVVSSLSQGQTGFRRTRYRAVIEPQLARAELCADWRLYRQQTVPQILDDVLKRSGVMHREAVLTKTHDVRPTVMQAGETHLGFVHRLAAESGLYYTHRHTATEHTLILGDRLYVHGVTDGGPVPYLANPGGDQREPCVWQFEYTEHVRTARVTQRDYSEDHPAYNHESEQLARGLDHQRNDYEIYRYPGRYPGATDTMGKLHTDTRLNALRAQAQLAQVTGDDARLQPGWAFDLEGHPRESWNTGWRVLSMVHEGTQATSQEDESADAQVGTHYQYSAQILPDRVEWKPPHDPRPIIDGLMAATVVGPAAEEIHVNSRGEVAVQFAFDRIGEFNEHSSHWVPVLQGWAGAGWGAMAIPRIGQQVMVGFESGDPDRPYVVGRAYNALNPPPYELPRHKTRTTIKSQTHKGKGSNELRFEDEAGQEEIYVHAQKDQNIVVEHDETTRVGHDRTEQVEHDERITIGHDRSENVGENEQVTIGKDRRHQIANDAFLSIERNHTLNIGKDHLETIGNHRQEKIAANHTIDVGGHVEATVQGHHSLHAGQRIERQTQRYELRVGESYEIHGPGGSIVVDKTGVTIEAINIKFKGVVHQSGGAANPLSFRGAPVDGSTSHCEESQR
ncbi:type VI secretion system tip protein TssI/VgrG [Dyella sp. ASV21]|uniref:type VI secretion system Vgr family protein n=1 Tax=Dyella sp. ASV21 TaxID=2795114 RepID=UPI0018EC4E1E|nr:type VI secretion system tip protein TssI/VgrG [Dyella sp. ASV21]